MHATPTRPLGRLGYAALVLLTLAPVALQGLWRPLAQALHLTVDAVGLARAAVAVAAVAVIVGGLCQGRASARWAPGVGAALAAAALGLLIGRDGAAIAVIGALGGVAALCGALLPWLLSRLPEELDAQAVRHKGVTAVMVGLGALAVHQTLRLSVFMGDATHPELSMAPDIPFFVRHSCLTAYVEGARLAVAGVPNLYDLALWPHLTGSAEAQANELAYAPFGLDSYAYPPPFLLLPRLLLTPLSDFAAQRAVWFALNGLVVAAGLWSISNWIGGRAGRIALLLAPAIWISPLVLGTLQVGNVHLMVMVAAMVALVAFETRRPALGGALLAFAVVSKISPGLVLVLLLLQRRFREVIWTGIWGLGYALAGLVVFGIAPYRAFLSYELPRLSSGEAMTFLAWPESVIINLAPFGLPFRLAALGLDVGDPWVLGRLCGQVFTLALLGLTVLAARRVGDPRDRAEVWAALLTLSALRSPLAPGYALFTLLWLMSTRAATLRGLAQAAGLAALWVGVSLPTPGTGAVQLAIALGQQALAIGLTLTYLLRPANPR